MVAHPFAGFHQLAYVTNDRDRAVERLADEYGVDGFETFDATFDLDGGGRTTVRGGLAMVGALQVEVVEPAGGEDAIYRDALPGGSAFHMAWHHVGFLLDSADELASVRDGLVGAGHRVALSGRNPGVATFCYVDTRAGLGHCLEYFALDR